MVTSPGLERSYRKLASYIVFGQRFGYSGKHVTSQITQINGKTLLIGSNNTTLGHLKVNIQTISLLFQIYVFKSSFKKNA